ncbi:MAG: HAD-IA family hydrolase [Anaerolineae bacterium]|nr:HAD-IA family hydrolase [Gloeobacterales cyanobacterium ES-bin-313]
MDHPPLLVFDLMDTVIVDPFYREVLDYLGTTLPDLGQVKHPTSWIEFETNLCDEISFLERFYRPETGLKLADPQAFKQVFRDNYRFLPGMEELLTELKAMGHSLWVLSNYSAWWQVARQKLALDRFFVGYCVSCDIGFRKPSGEAYSALINAIGHENLVLIDDRSTNIEGARQIGIEGILFEDAKRLRNALKKRSIL